MRISDWSSDVCSSDLDEIAGLARRALVGGIEIVGMQFRVMLRHAAEQGDAADGVEIGGRLPGRTAPGHRDHRAHISRALCVERVCETAEIAVVDTKLIKTLKIHTTT